MVLVARRWGRPRWNSVQATRRKSRKRVYNAPVFEVKKGNVGYFGLSDCLSQEEVMKSRTVTLTVSMLMMLVILVANVFGAEPPTLSEGGHGQVDPPGNPHAAASHKCGVHRS